ncbi:MAG: hypothetical protein ABL872_16750 [Lacibacter sp.]
MNYFPFKRIKIHTSLTEDEVMHRLREKITLEPQFFSFNFDYSIENKPYSGKIWDNKFRISRRIDGRNSFLPVIEGEILKTNNTTKVVARLRMHIYTYTMWFIMLLFLINGMISTSRMIYSKGDMNYGFLILFFVTLFIYFFALIPFNIEASRSKKFFFELLEADDISV